MTFGSYVRERREAQQLSRQTVAAAARSTVASLSRIENDRHVPRPDTALRIFAALHVDQSEALKIYCEADLRCGRLVSAADYFLDNGLLHAARRFIRKAFKANRDAYNQRYNGELYRLLGRWAYATGKYGLSCRAFALWDEALQKRGAAANIARAHFDFGMALGKVGRVRDALLRLNEARATFRTLNLPQLEAYTHWAMATILLRIGSFVEAAEEYQQAQRHLSGHERDTTKIGELVSRIGAGDGEMAEELGHGFQESDPEVRDMSRYALGVYERQKGNWRRTITILEDVIRISVSSEIVFAAHIELCLCYLRVGARDTARIHCIEAIDRASGATSATDLLIAKLCANHLGIDHDNTLPTGLYDSDWEHRTASLMTCDFFRHSRSDPTPPFL